MKQTHTSSTLLSFSMSNPETHRRPQILRSLPHQQSQTQQLMAPHSKQALANCPIRLMVIKPSHQPIPIHPLPLHHLNHLIDLLRPEIPTRTSYPMLRRELRTSFQLRWMRRVVGGIDVELLHRQVERADLDVLLYDPHGDEVPVQAQDLGRGVVAGFDGGEDCGCVASQLGYRESKHVSERILSFATERYGLPTSILRVGQIAGPLKENGGAWHETEWFPTLVKTSRNLGLIPTTISDINWIPVDTLATVMLELVHHATKNSISQV